MAAMEDFQHMESKSLRDLQILSEIERTESVTQRFQKVAYLLVFLGNTALGRTTLRLLFPGMRRVRNDQWPGLLKLVRAHEQVQKESGYYAFVFDKPA